MKKRHYFWLTSTLIAVLGLSFLLSSAGSRSEVMAWEWVDRFGQFLHTPRSYYPRYSDFPEADLRCPGRPGRPCDVELTADRFVVNPTNPGDEVTFTASVTDAAGDPVAGQSVQIVSGSELFPSNTRDDQLRPGAFIITDSRGVATARFAPAQEDVIDFSAVAVSPGADQSAEGASRSSGENVITSNNVPVIVNDPETELYNREAEVAASEQEASDESDDVDVEERTTEERISVDVFNHVPLNNGNMSIKYKAVTHGVGTKYSQFMFSIGWEATVDSSRVGNLVGTPSSWYLYSGQTSGSVRFDFLDNALDQEVTFYGRITGVPLDTPGASAQVLAEKSFTVHQVGPTTEQLDEAERAAREGLRLELTTPNLGEDAILPNSDTAPNVKINGTLSYNGQPVEGRVEFRVVATDGQPGQVSPQTARTYESGRTPATGRDVGTGFEATYDPGVAGDRYITITANATILRGEAAGSTPSATIELTQGQPEAEGTQPEEPSTGGEEAEQPGAEEEGGTSGGEGPYNQKGEIKIDIEKVNEGSDSTAGYLLEVTTTYQGELVDANLIAESDGLWGRTINTRRGVGTFHVRYIPNEQARQHPGNSVLILMEATYITKDNQKVSGTADFPINAAFVDMGSSEKIRVLKFQSNRLQLEQPAGGFSFGKPRGSFYDSINDLTNYNVPEKYWAVIRAELRDGDGAPIAGEKIDFSIESGVSSGRYAGYIATAGYQNNHFLAGGAHPITGTTNSEGFADLYYVVGSFTNRDVHITAKHTSLTETGFVTSADVTIKIKPLEFDGTGGGGTSGDGDEDTDGGGEETDDSQFAVRVDPTELTFNITDIQADPPYYQATVTFHQPAQSEMSKYILLGIEVKSGMVKISAGGPAGSRGNFIGKYYKPDKEAKEESYSFTIFYDKNMQFTKEGEIHISVSGEDKNGEPLYDATALTISFAGGGTEEQNQAKDLEKIWSAISLPVRSGGEGQRVVTTTFDASVLNNLSRHTNLEFVAVELAVIIKTGDAKYVVNDGKEKTLAESFSLRKYNNLKVVVIGSGSVEFSVTVLLNPSLPSEDGVNWKQRNVVYNFGLSDDESSDTGDSGEESSTEDWYDPSQPLSSLNINQSLSNLNSYLSGSQYLSQSSKDKITQYLQEAKSNPDNWESIFANITSLLNKDTSGQRDAAAVKELYRRMGNAALDLINRQMRSDPKKTEAQRKQFDQLAQRAKQGDGDAVVDMRRKLNLGYYGGFSRATGYFEQGGMDTRNYQDLDQSGNNGTSGQSGSGINLRGITNSISQLFTNISGAQAAEGDASAPAINFWRLLWDKLVSLFK